MNLFSKEIQYSNISKQFKYDIILNRFLKSARISNYFKNSSLLIFYMFFFQILLVGFLKLLNTFYNFINRLQNAEMVHDGFVIIKKKESMMKQLFFKTPCSLTSSNLKAARKCSSSIALKLENIKKVWIPNSNYSQIVCLLGFYTPILLQK